jgi:hypothetical protein
MSGIIERLPPSTNKRCSCLELHAGDTPAKIIFALFSVLFWIQVQVSVTSVGDIYLSSGFSVGHLL